MYACFSYPYRPRLAHISKHVILVGYGRLNPQVRDSGWTISIHCIGWVLSTCFIDLMFDLARVRFG